MWSVQRPEVLVSSVTAAAAGPSLSKLVCFETSSRPLPNRLVRSDLEAFGTGGGEGSAEIAAFLQVLYAEIPHFLYFLNPDRASGAIDIFFASVGALCETEHGVWVLWSDDVATVFYRALAAAAEFAISRGDDWVAVVRGFEYSDGDSRLSEIRAILVSRGVIPA